MTSYPSTELPLCGERTKKPPSSKYLLFLSLFKWMQKYSSGPRNLQDLTSSYY